MASTETFAANQGQNRSCGWPLRSLSAMTLMPFVSTWSGRSSAVPVASVMAVLPYWAPLVIHDRFALRPVNRDVGAVYEAGPRRGEKGDQRRDLFWLADAAEGDRLLSQLVRALLGHALVAGEGLLQRVPPVGVHRAGVDGVAADPVSPVLFGGRGGEVDVRGVGHPGGHLPVTGLEAVVADDEHDRALATLAHVADDRAYRPDVAHELQVEARHPLLFGQVLEQSAGRTARAGDQDVDLAEPLEGDVDTVLDVLGHAHVAGQRQHRPASIGGDLLRGGVERRGSPGGDDHVTAFPGQELGHAPADALAGARDEGDLPVQPQIHRNPFRLATAARRVGVFPREPRVPLPATADAAPQPVGELECIPKISAAEDPFCLA